jgi:3-dehydrosphinganine reductase
MFDGQKIIITGGSSGLGKALARRLAGNGANLALIARDRGKLEAARDELAAVITPGRKVLVFSCDVSDHAQVERTFAEIEEKLGPPQILINSAGVLKEGRFEKLLLEDFRHVMDINFYGTLNCVKAILPYFQKQGGGRIVNLGSMGGRIGPFGYAAYSSSKFAVHGLSEVLRCELKPQKIVVQLVSPPEFESPMVDELNTYRTPENKRHAQTIPVMTTEEVADEVMKGLEGKRFLIVPGRVTRFLDFANRVAPSLSRLIGDAQIKLAYRGPHRD